ncbi:MAG: TonB-dependent receptor [Saprospiraceae bacterium]|nr:TonB-dependent receptor [Saprospiraceae bacterium]
MFCLELHGQNITIRGIVKDSITNETLLGTYIIHGTNIIDVDANGYFEFKVLTPSLSTIEVRNLGYTTKTCSLKDLKSDKINHIVLSPILSTEIVIMGHSERNDQKSGGNFKLSSKDIKRLSSLAGEADVMQALYFKSGFQPITEGFSGVVARGGLPDQNLLLLNGVRIYNYAHLFGFLPYINGDMIKDVSISKSGFAGKYGGRSSSVIDITMYDGNNKKTEIDLTAGILMSKLTLKLPLIKNKWGINIAGRISNLAIVNLFSGIDYENKENASAVGINIYDYTISTKYNISSSAGISGFMLISSDKIRVKEKFNFIKEDLNSAGWRNSVFGLKFNKIFKNSWTIDANAGYLSYNNFQLSESQLNNKITRKSEIMSGLDESSLNFSFTKYFSNLLIGSFGLGYHNTTFDFVNFYDLNDTSKVEPVFLDNLFAYFSSIWKWKKWTSRIDTRYDIFVTEKQKGILQPRVNVSYKHNDNITFAGALDITSQSAFQIPTFNGTAPMDIWVPVHSNDFINLSTQYSIGAKTLVFRNIHLSSDLFYKKQTNIAENRAIYTSLNKEISNIKNTLSYDGELEAFGCELNVQVNSDKFALESSYTYTHSVTSFRDIQDGVPYTTNFLRPHAFSFQVNYQPSHKWDFTLKSLFLSGQPFTAPVNAYFDNNNEVQLIFEKRNNGRYPNYIRIDIGVIYHLSKKSSWSLSIYNVTANRNPFHLFLQPESSSMTFGDRSSSYYDGVNFTLLPSISYSRKFK